MRILPVLPAGLTDDQQILIDFEIPLLTIHQRDRLDGVIYKHE
jgi:hypothetical protein